MTQIYDIGFEERIAMCHQRLWEHCREMRDTTVRDSRLTL